MLLECYKEITNTLNVNKIVLFIYYVYTPRRCFKLETNNLKQRNGKIKRLLNRKVIAIATIVVILVATIAISTNAYVRQANQVAQLKELNDQLILEQRKQKKESDENIAELKKLVANQETQVKELASKSKKLEDQSSKILEENEILKLHNNGLERANKDLLKKYRELAKP